MISAAVETPPISSATTWTSGSSTTSCQRDVRLASGKRLNSSGGFSMTDREQTTFTCKGKPSLASICAALSARIRSVPRPTFPSPMRPKLTADTDLHYTERSKNECLGGEWRPQSPPFVEWLRSVLRPRGVLIEASRPLLCSRAKRLVESITLSAGGRKPPLSTTAYFSSGEMASDMGKVGQRKSIAST